MHKEIKSSTWCVGFILLSLVPVLVPVSFSVWIASFDYAQFVLTVFSTVLCPCHGKLDGASIIIQWEDNIIDVWFSHSWIHQMWRLPASWTVIINIVCWVIFNVIFIKFSIYIIYNYYVILITRIQWPSIELLIEAQN